MTTCKEEATRWVHRYAAGGAAFAAIPIPMSTSAGLVAIETMMLATIGEIYGDPVHGVTGVAASGTFGVLGQGLKWVALQGALFVPFLGLPLRMGIAGGTIVGLGHAIVSHYERKYPSKQFRKAVPAAVEIVEEKKQDAPEKDRECPPG